MEEAEWALKPLVMPPAAGKGSIPGRGALGRLTALMPGTSMPGPSGPLLLSDPLSGSFSAAMHQPSCSRGSSPLLKANYKGTVPQLPPPPDFCAKAAAPCNRESCEQRAMQGRDHSSKDKNAGNGGDPPPPAIAVSGCLLGRRRTVWQRGAGLPRPSCGCPSGTAAPPGTAAGTVCSKLGRRRRGVTGATWGWRGVRRSRQTAGFSLPFLRSAVVEGEKRGKEKAGQKTVGIQLPHPKVFESELQSGKEEGGGGGERPSGLRWMMNTRTPITLEKCCLPGRRGWGGVMCKTQGLGWDGTPQLRWGPQDSSPSLAGRNRIPCSDWEPQDGTPIVAGRNGVPCPDCLPAIKCPLMGL